MTLLTKLKEEDVALVDILRHPILGPEFIRNFNDIPEDPELPIDFNNDSYYTHTDYQRLMLCDFNPYVSFCTARAIGKTESLIDKMIFYLLNVFWNDQYITFLTPSRVHLEPVFRKLRRWLQDNNFLKHLVDRGSINSATFTVKLKSGGVLDCRIAGTTGTGQNVVGLHTPVVLIDEAAYFPWGTWGELQPIINHWLEGFQVLIAGVPDGRRERSVLFHVDQKDPNYTHHRVSSHDNPRWDDRQEARAIEQYGGRNGEDYIHMVLGEHGSPVFSVFDRALMRIELYDTIHRELHAKDTEADPQAGYKQILELPNLPKNYERCIVGIDLGFSEPTAIVILYLVNGRWYQHARMTWTQIPYPEQERLIAYLDNKFSPELIGIDEGNSGKAVVQHLLSETRFEDHKFQNRLISIPFSSTVTIGVDEEGNDIKIRAKEHAVQYLQQLTNTHTIVYSKLDDDLITEFERTTYTKSVNGALTFRTLTEKGGNRGGDHHLSAYLCAFLAWYLKNESLFNGPSKPKLYTRTQWIFT